MPNQQSTSTPVTRKQMSSGPLWAVAALALMLVSAIIFGVSQREGPTGSVDALDGDPAFVAPTVPVPTPRPLTLTLDLPALSDMQMYWLHRIQVMPKCPICNGVDRPPVVFTDNEATIVTALYLTECSYNPFDEWGNFLVHPKSGARGCSQLMGPLITPENMWNPDLNIYDGMVEIRRLIDANSGDIMETLRNYKGVDPDDPTTQEQATSVFNVIRIGG